jgi:peptide/nickel transport system substrate-binding protein
MRGMKGIGRTLIIGIIIVIIVIAGVVGYYLTIPTGTKVKDTIVMGTTDSVETSLDPANAYDYFAWEIIRSLGSGLVDYRPGATGPSDIIPDLATSWSTSSDGLQWTFTLRQGVKYDDGTEFNATHVKYSFDRNMQMADPNGPFVGIGFSDIIQDVTVVDAFTVRFDLKIPFSPFLSLIAGQECVMVDPKYAPMHGTSWNYTTDVVLYTEGNARASNPMGLGPYTLSNWTRSAGKDAKMTLVANPNYWNASAGIPKTKNVIIQFYADSTGLALAITAPNIDIAFRQLGVTDINTMKANANLKVWQGTGAFIQYLCFQEKYAPFNQTSIRQAVGAAINRTALVNTVFQGQAQNLYSMIPIGMAGHTDAFQGLGDPNYTRTQELLAPFGYNATNKLTFDLYYETSGHYPQSPQQAQVLKSSIEASGVITVNLQSLDWPAFGSARRAETMPAFIMGWYPDYIDADDYIFPFLDSSGGSWIHMNYADTQMDQLIAWARGNTSDTIRNSLYGQIETLMVTDSPIIPLYQGSAYAVTVPKVNGVYLDITQNWRHWLVYEEQ